MKNKIQIKKIGLAVLVFLMMSIITSYPMKTRINALEQEKTKLTEENNEKYKGDSSDEEMDKINDDIVIKIISKLDSTLDINYVNKFDEVDEENKAYSKIELSVSGDLNKIKGIEKVLNDMKLNYKIENMDVKNRAKENGDKIDNYVDCVMTFTVK
ncbi:MAG: hypothetical protein RSG52_10645 [Terrisporobacter sp.]|uniref:hypothetical protein n=1 Tax=Terrisporobacter sp. TaxID=1965305 RepID=UPI002FC99C72